ncbi:MAG: hypothetical protein DRI44_08795 [Chlamydiae bacterium]|nr:MAG: hypothetical protein DRI44_08795 [Chlamydiota bacterium]
MGRPPRIEGEDLWYHVFNRGNEKRDVFFSDSERTYFLDFLFESAETFNVEVHNYALMSNHFHLFIRTLEPNLCRFMQGFMNKFVKVYNTKRERVGRLFQGPYRAIVVDSNEYGHELSRYIHLNYVRGHKWKNVSVRKRLEALNEYPWSSYRVYAGLEEPHWPIKSSEILSDFGATLEKQRKQYARYVKEGLLKEIDPFADVVARSILGGEGFVHSIKELLKGSARHDATAAHISLRLLSPELDEVITSVEKEYDILRDLFLVPGISRSNKLMHVREARNVFLWAAAKVCTGRLTLWEIGARAGGITASAIASARQRVENQKLKNSILSEHCRSVLARMGLEESTLPADRWSHMYMRLAVYNKKFGHCLVPYKYLADPQLGKWVQAQRAMIEDKHVADNPELCNRIKKLNKLGFSWKLGETGRKWEKMFDKLKAFALLFGHCNVPNKWEPNLQLANWVNEQRKLAKQNRLEKTRKERLEELNIDWGTSHTFYS